MSARGRGGASSRGGRNTTFTYQQMQQLGLFSFPKEVAPVKTGPPPLYPPLKTKPLPVQKSESKDSLVEWKLEFIKDMRKLQYQTVAYKRQAKLWDHQSKPLTVYEQQQQQTNRKRNPYHWHRMPKQLQKFHLKRKLKKANRLKRKAATAEANRVSDAGGKKAKLNTGEPKDIIDKLEKLEERETNKPDTPAAKKDNTESDKEDEEDEEELVADEEFDEENDYGVNYFDNGEAYNEDDDIDDGPVY